MAYSNTADVVNLLPNNIALAISDDTVIQKPITLADIEKYITWADQQIDSAISIIYKTPIKRIATIAASGQETVDYPDPIRTTSSMLAAHLVYQKLFAESQNPDQKPKYSEEYEKIALNNINAIRNGSLILKGQRQIGKRYLRQESRDAPKLPYKFEDYKGGQ